MTEIRPNDTLKAVITRSYAELSDALRQSADYVVQNQLDVATRSLRAVAGDSGASPTSFSRLARALGYPDYEALRDHARADLANDRIGFSSKARQLQRDSSAPLLPRQVQACVDNIAALASECDIMALEAAADCLARARHVVVLGALGSAGFADYIAYLMSWFNGNWSVAGRNGISLASSLSRLSDQDAVLVISKNPYATRTLQGMKSAAEKGASIIAITDSHAFPGLAHADHSFVVHTDSPQFFSSYAATLVLLETLVGLLVARAGGHIEDDIQNVIEENRRLGEFGDA